MPEVIAVIGASGYIGRNLILALAQVKDYRVKVLSRKTLVKSSDFHWPAGVEVVQGDINIPASLIGFFETGCTVINLAYFWHAGEGANLSAIMNILNACEQRKVKRLIHCSTAAVVGRVPDDQITESTACRPVTAYGITKLKIEQVLQGRGESQLDLAILRPTSVFGPGGEPLKKLANDLVNGSRLRNYLKSCLFGRRRMNLVCIANVVAAIQFLIKRTERLEDEIFIVSDDNDPKNNFADIEQFLMQYLGCPNYAIPKIYLPLGILAMLLRCLKRNNINPRCNYDQKSLEKLGFRKSVAFEDGLKVYAAWYDRKQLNGMKIAE